MIRMAKTNHTKNVRKRDETDRRERFTISARRVRNAVTARPAYTTNAAAAAARY